MNVLKLAVCAMMATTGMAAMAQSESGGTGLFVEPGVTYQRTDSRIDYPAGTGTPGNSQANTRGFGVVVRGGIHVFERFFVAADARYAPSLGYSDNANNFNTDASSWDIAPVVGFQMKDVGVRFYGGYILAGNLDPKSDGGLDYKFEDPTGWRLGAGLKVWNVSVNLEWQRLHYDSAKITARPTGVTFNSEDIKYNGDGLVASVTFPFEFN